MTLKGRQPTNTIIINYCVKCDVAGRGSVNTLVKRFNQLLETGSVHHMQWGDCSSHRPLETGTLISVYLPWEEITK